jgi:hypothetical protein
MMDGSMASRAAAGLGSLEARMMAAAVSSATMVARAIVLSIAVKSPN